MSYPPPVAPRPARPKWPRRLLITVLVLVLALVALDRIGDYVAEQVAATSVRQSQDLDHEPDVDIGGFPFLTQLATRRFDQITVTAKDVPVGGDGVSVSISRLRVVLDDLTVSRDFHDFHADNAHAVGTVGYAELSRIFGVDISYAGDGRVRARKKITILGQTITPTVTAAPVFVDGALTFGKGQVNGLGSLGGQVANVLDEVFGVDVPLQGIPFDITVQKLSMDEGGLRIDLVGSDLTYRRDG